MRAQDLREDGGGFEEKAGKRRSWWRTPQRRKMESDFTYWGLLWEYPSSALPLRGEMAADSLSRPTRSLWLAPGGRTWVPRAESTAAVPLKSFSIVSTNAFWGGSCYRARLSEGSRVFGLRDLGSLIGPFPILRLGSSYCKDLFTETPLFWKGLVSQFCKDVYIGVCDSIEAIRGSKGPCSSTAVLQSRKCQRLPNVIMRNWERTTNNQWHEGSSPPHDAALIRNATRFSMGVYLCKRRASVGGACTLSTGLSRENEKV